MKFTFGQDICLMRFFGRIEQTYADRFVIDLYFGQPLAVFFSDAKKAAFVTWSWLACVLRVFHIGNFAQIGPTIVRSIAVYVVYLFFGPTISLVKPRQSVRKIQSVIQTYDNIAILSYTSGFTPQTASSAGFGPSKNARVRAVAHKFFETFWGHAVNINPVMCGGQA